MALEQKYLNVTTRAEAYMDIMMYVPDNSVSIANVTSDDILQYSNIDSLKDIKNYTSTTIATLEENLWLLDGSFINPTSGRLYNGYISNSISNENGEFENNPKINIELSNISNITYFSIILNPSVSTGYPKNINITFFDSSNNQVGDILTKNITEETSLPNLVYEVNLENISKLEIEFVGTVTPYRRIRVSSIMFGKVLTLNQDQVLSTDYLDKCSYVPDSIPSRTFSFTLENYNKQYNIDNPDNNYIDLDSQTKVMFRNGYNIYGYEMDSDGNATINNPDNVKQIEWDDWKELRLLDVSTNSEDECTFECGSVLDMMTDTYTKERFINNRTVRYIVNQLLNFMGVDTNIVIYSTDGIIKSDGTDTSYGDYIINTVLPELPVRELIQLLAFSVGATLLIKDDGTIKFANLELDKPSSFTHQHSFTYDDFEAVPEAQQLENTTKISLPKYNSTIGTSEEEIQSFDIGTYNAEVTYSACVPTGAKKADDDTSSGSIQSSDLYAYRGSLVMNIPEENVTTKVIIVGYPINTVTTQERSVTNDTLIINTQLMSNDVVRYEDGKIVDNECIKTKYKTWYSKKFKYVITTRGEPLVDAGDYAEIQTPFSGTEQLLRTFVLQNHITFDGTWSGDMEVVAL